MSESARTFPFDGTRIAVLADCHIHAGGPQFPPALLDRLQGVDLIVTLGDMGEASGLDQLTAIAPVVGVRGQDDSDDPRTNQSALVVTASNAGALGCVFDPVAAGLATSADPFVPVPDLGEACLRVFGRRVAALLFASTHKCFHGADPQLGLLLNPGSAVLPAEGGKRTFLDLEIARVTGASALPGMSTMFCSFPEID